MRAVVLSAAPAGHPSLAALSTVLNVQLAQAGYLQIKIFDLTTTPLAFCQGEFDCWVKTPGHCRTRDAEEEIVAAVHRADALVLLGPVAFGGHDPRVKRAFERLLCLLEPFFTTHHGLTHHRARYEPFARVFSVGWSPDATAEIAETFDDLNDANALNFMAPGCGSLLLDDAESFDWARQIGAMLAMPRTPGSSLDARMLRPALLAAAAPDRSAEGPAKIRRAALLVGSPKARGTSASEKLARAMASRLIAAEVETEIHVSTAFVRDDARSAALAREIASSDLFVLVTPLYVDSLPSLATQALKQVARARATHRNPARFVTVINCGFPEPEQTRTALRIARHFADQAGYAWGGALPLGGGGMITPERSLDEPHGPLAHVARALDLACPALAAGEPLPHEAIEAMASSSLPGSIYRLIGDLGWRWQAHENGLDQGALHARPLDDPEPAEDSDEDREHP